MLDDQQIEPLRRRAQGGQGRLRVDVSDRFVAQGRQGLFVLLDRGARPAQDHHGAAGARRVADGRRHHRQPDLERAARSGHAAHVEGAVLLLDEFERGREPEAGSGRTGGEERLEDPRERRLVHAAAGIADPDPDMIARAQRPVGEGLPLRQGDPVELDLDRSIRARRLHGVADQVVHHLLELRRLAADDRPLGRPGEPDHGRVGRRGADLGDRLGDDRLDGAGALHRAAAPPEIENLAGDLVRPSAGLDQHLDLPRRPIGMRRQGLGRDLGMAEHDVEDVVDVVRDTAGEGADGLEPLCPAQLPLDRAALRPDLLALQRRAEAVGDDLQQAARLPEPARQIGGAALEAQQADGALAPTQPRAGPRDDAALGEGVPQGRMPGRVRGLDEDEVVRGGGDVGDQGALRHRPAPGLRKAGPVPQMHGAAAVEHQDIAMVRVQAPAHHGQDVDDVGGDLVGLAPQEAVGGLGHDGLEGDRPTQDQGAGPHQQAHAHGEGEQRQGGGVEREAETIGAGLALGVQLPAGIQQRLAGFLARRDRKRARRGADLGQQIQELAPVEHDGGDIRGLVRRQGHRGHGVEPRADVLEMLRAPVPRELRDADLQGGHGLHEPRIDVRFGQAIAQRVEIRDRVLHQGVAGLEALDHLRLPVHHLGEGPHFGVVRPARGPQVGHRRLHLAQMGDDRIVVAQMPGAGPKHVVLEARFGQREAADGPLHRHIGRLHLAIAVDQQPRQQRGQQRTEYGGLRGQPHGRWSSVGGGPGGVAGGTVTGWPS